MKINKTSKFDVGDKVWVLFEKLEKCMISGIRFETPSGEIIDAINEMRGSR